MTRHLAQKLIVFLSDLDANQSEFEEFSQWLRHGGLETAINLALTLREHLPASAETKKAVGKTAQSKVGRNLNTQIIREVQVISVPDDDKVFKEVYRLLVKELKLKKSEALREMAQRLHFNGSLPVGISFSEGVSRLVNYAGESKVLNVAQMMRNRKLASVQSDWPLVDKDGN